MATDNWADILIKVARERRVSERNMDSPGVRNRDTVRSMEGAMDGYKFKYMADDGERVECESCRFKAPLAEVESHSRPVMHLCALCYGSMASLALERPIEYDGATLSTICYVGNAILAALGKQDADQ